LQKAPHVTGYLTELCGDDAYGQLDGYRRAGGYQAAERAIREMTPGEVVETVVAAGLAGRGGMGSSVGEKWALMPTRSPGSGGGAHYLVCNANESEPGSFKDRLLLERAPHMLLEGILIAAHAIGAEKTFLYVRGEYAEAARVVARVIEEARGAGLLGERVFSTDFTHDVVLVLGAGSYICGEETGLLESLEGKRGLPRRRPMQPAAHHVFGMPATVHNVETLCHLPHILGRGTAWFRGFGTDASPGTTLFGVSGHVARPGLYELPLGTPLDEIIFEHAGGVAEGGENAGPEGRGRGRKVKGVIPGGLSQPILPVGQLDVGMSDELLAERGTALGTGGIIVMDDTTCMVRTACIVTHFFRDESCGQCTQCREGTSWLNKIVMRIERGAGTLADLEVLEDVSRKMEGQTICAFSDAAAGPVLGLLRHFRNDFISHITDRQCPFPGSFELG
jgi:NADH-quinone oxidoreductase subunit F